MKKTIAVLAYFLFSLSALGKENYRVATEAEIQTLEKAAYSSSLTCDIKWHNINVNLHRFIGGSVEVATDLTIQPQFIVKGSFDYEGEHRLYQFNIHTDGKRVLSASGFIYEIHKVQVGTLQNPIYETKSFPVSQIPCY